MKTSKEALSGTLLTNYKRLLPEPLLDGVPNPWMKKKLSYE